MNIIEQRPKWVNEIISQSSDLKKIKVCDCICHGQLVDHTLIKDRVLSEIERDYCEDIVGGDVEYSVIDRVSKLDWSKHKDLTRPWVKIFLPNFHIALTNFFRGLGYVTYSIEGIWYQQYSKGDTHGWHTHGSMYTGVYYLEFPKGSSKTELYSPFNFKKHTINSKEGDIIMFPGHWIHRGPPNTSERKTIISFNFGVDLGDRATE